MLFCVNSLYNFKEVEFGSGWVSVKFLRYDWFYKEKAGGQLKIIK